MSKKRLAAIVGFIVVVVGYLGYEVSPDVQETIINLITDIADVLEREDADSYGL